MPLTFYLTFQMFLSWTQASGCPFLAGTISYQQSGGATTYLTYAQMQAVSAGIGLSDITAGQTIFFTGKRNCTDNVLIGIGVGMTVQVNYDNADGRLSTFLL